MKHNLWKVVLSFILAVIASAALALPAFAVPQDPTPRVVEQSCGIPLTVRFLGDEFLTWTETLSGDVIAYNRDTNNWYYAYVSDGHIYPGDEKVRLITPLFGSSPDTITVDDMCEVFEAASYYRAQFESTLRPITLTNNRVTLLVMLIEFSDRELSDVYLTPEFPTHTSFFSNEFFGDEGKTVNTYFAKSSHDFNLQFIEPDFTVENGFRIENPTPDVALLEVRDGVVRVRVNAPHPNPEDPRGNPAAALNPSIRAAFDAAREHIDLSDIPRLPITSYRPGEVIGAEHFIISTVITGYEFTASNNQQPRINGHASSIGGAGTIGVRYGAMGELSTRTIQGNTYYNAFGIGGAIHEIGHLFGLPDLYGHFPTRPSLGRFSVMCVGSHISAVPNGRSGDSPPLLDPWSKTQLGFIEPVTVDASEHRILNIYGMDAGSPYNVVRVISDACPDQYFLIENRRMVGFDAPLSRSNTNNHGGIPRGEGGILIYHVDERIVRDERLGGGRRGSFDFNSNDFHRGVDLEAMMVAPIPTGRSSVDFNPFFVQGGLRYSFTPTTTPNSNFHTPGLCNDHRRVNYDCHPQTVVSNIHIQVNDVAGQVMEIEVGIPCPVVAQGRLPDQVGGEGLRGAPWTLCECGVLTVGGGFIRSTATTSPWNAHRLKINEIVFTGPIVAGPSLAHFFRDLPNVVSIEGLEHFDTSNVTDMSRMFSDVRALTNLDVSNFDTSNVTNMSNMFNNARAVTSLDVSSWDTGSVTNMSSMFTSASSLTSLDVSNWDTSRVTNMSNMFWWTGSLVNLDVSNFDTSNVTNMSNMFSNAWTLTSLDVSNFDTSNVTNMSSMFTRTSSLTSLDVSNFDTSNVTNMSSMFQWTDSLAELDVSNFDTSRVTNMWQMFLGARSLTSLDLSNWDTHRVVHSSNMTGMLTDTTALRNLTLGENVRFIGLPNLPAVRANAEFTGFWQNVGNGTVERPLGEHVLTSAELMAQFNGATMADTWVWQPVISE